MASSDFWCRIGDLRKALRQVTLAPFNVTRQFVRQLRLKTHFDDQEADRGWLVYEIQTQIRFLDTLGVFLSWKILLSKL